MTGVVGLDLIAGARHGMEALPGIQKFVIDCNWKFTVDKLFDWYHPMITHMSAFASGILPSGGLNAAPAQDRPEWRANRRRSGFRALHSGMADNITVLGGHPNIFPTSWVAPPPSGSGTTFGAKLAALTIRCSAVGNRLRATSAVWCASPLLPRAGSSCLSSYPKPAASRLGPDGALHHEEHDPGDDHAR